MKTFRKFSLLFSLATILSLGSGWTQEIDCRMVAENVHKAVQSAPNHTLTVVEDALVAAPGCVCEIVKAAIDASNADGDLVKKIVYTAVRTTQQHAPIIAECAVAAAPDHADAVRAAFAEAFEDAPRTTKTKKQPKPVQVASAPEQKPRPQPKAQPKSRPRPVAPAAPDPAPVIYEQTETVLAEMPSGKQVVEFAPNYAFDSKGVVEFDPPVEEDYRPEITFLGGPPIDLSGLYLVPPVANSRSFFEEDEKEDRDSQVRSLSTTIRRTPPGRVPTRPRSPRPPVISKPMSPTGP